MATKSELEPVRPRPDLTPDTEGYWRSARNHQLAIQRCSDCKSFRHNPRPMCPECHSLAFEWAPVSGRGTIYSYIIADRVLHPYWKEPYNVVLIELEEGIRIISNLIDCPNEAVEIGMQVKVVFEDVSDEISLPMFKLDTNR